MSRKILFVCCLFSLASITSLAQDKEEIKKRVKAALAADTATAAKLVNDDLAAVRYIAIKKLCEANYDKSKLIPILLKALDDKDSVPIRVLAAENLGKLKVKEAAKKLCEVMLNPDEERIVRLAVEDALAKICDDLPKELRDAIAKAVKKEDTQIVEDPEATKQALEKYRAWYEKKFGSG